MKVKGTPLLVIGFSGLLLLTACKGTPPDTLSIGQPITIEGLELNLSPPPMEAFHNDEMGITSIKVLDSLIIIGHRDCWSIYDKYEKRHIGNFLSVGDGPEELLYIPPCSNAYFATFNDTLCAWVPDKDHHRILRMNIRKCMERDPSYMTIQTRNDNMNNRTWDVIPCDSDSYLLSQPHDDMRGFNRILWHSDEIEKLGCMTPVDAVKVNDETAINLLSRVTYYEPTTAMFVEAMGYLNQINIFSRDGAKGKTICVGNHLDDIVEMEKKFMTAERIEGYSTLSAWPCGFGAVYSGATDLQRMTDSNVHSEFQFFDWNGNPKYCFRLPGYILAFDIDFDEKILYTVSEQNDELKTYDASSIIEKLL